MKPSKRIYCRECGRSKLLFETEKKALTFIKFNADEIEAETGRKPERASESLVLAAKASLELQLHIR